MNATPVLLSMPRHPADLPSQQGWETLVKTVAIAALAALSLAINFVLFPLEIAVPLFFVEALVATPFLFSETIWLPSSPRLFVPPLLPRRVAPILVQPTPVYRTIPHPVPQLADPRPRERVGDGHINWQAPATVPRAIARAVARPTPVDPRPREPVGYRSAYRGPVPSAPPLQRHPVGHREFR